MREVNGELIRIGYSAAREPVLFSRSRDDAVDGMHLDDLRDAFLAIILPMARKIERLEQRENARINNQFCGEDGKWITG